MTFLQFFGLITLFADVEFSRTSDIIRRNHKKYVLGFMIVGKEGCS